MSTLQPKLQLAHSFSSITLHETCPKQYHARYIEKSIRSVDTEASLAGTRDHKSLEDRLKDGTPLPPHLKKHEDKCETILNSGLIVQAEQELAFNKELEPVSWWDQDVFVRAKVDVALYGASHAALLDWKSGQRRPKNFQLELGTLAQWIHYPTIKSTRAAFLWLRDDSADKEHYTRDEDYERILNKLKSKTARIEQDVEEGIWQAKGGYHCNWCELRNTCTSSQARR